MAPLVCAVLACQHSFINKLEKSNNDIKTCADRLPEGYNTSPLLNKNARQSAITVVYYSSQPSSLAIDLVRYLRLADIAVTIILQEDQLWSYLNRKAVSCLIIETKSNNENLISRCHAYKTVRSILVRCQEQDLTCLQRHVRSYAKVDGVYADDARILIKLVIDLTLIFEEMGDEARQDKYNEFEAQQHYDRALKLCDLVKKL